MKRKAYLTFNALKLCHNGADKTHLTLFTARTFYRLNVKGTLGTSPYDIRNHSSYPLKLFTVKVLLKVFKIQNRNLKKVSDVIMTSLPKQCRNSAFLETRQFIYLSKGNDEECPKMYFFIVIESLNQVMVI